MIKQEFRSVHKYVEVDCGEIRQQERKRENTRTIKFQSDFFSFELIFQKR